MSRVQGKSQEGRGVGATIKLCNLVPVLTSLHSALTQKRRVAQGANAGWCGGHRGQEPEPRERVLGREPHPEVRRGARAPRAGVLAFA